MIIYRLIFLSVLEMLVMIKSDVRDYSSFTKILLLVYGALQLPVWYDKHTKSYLTFVEIGF